jgi:beta-1,4-N-acetylglucosaminyltransferase
VTGGHTAEMMQLIKGLNPSKYTPRSYFLADMDSLSEEKAIQYEEKLGEVIRENKGKEKKF